MQHVIFARFPDRDRAATAIRSIAAGGDRSAEVVAHFGASNAQEFEQVVQHSGAAAETDVRHALVVGVLSGGLTGALLGPLLAAIDLFPGTTGQGALFGVVMGVLVGLLMMSVFGSGLMDTRLRRLTRDLRRGEVVVTIRTANRPDAERIREACVAHDAEVAEKSPL
ncbi:MAG: hypothetical protein ACK595_04385 [Planctomycetota bacterium]|jgi:hypothetical protein